MALPSPAGAQVLLTLQQQLAEVGFSQLLDDYFEDPGGWISAQEYLELLIYDLWNFHWPNAGDPEDRPAYDYADQLIGRAINQLNQLP